jgi:hypothetical protein
MLEAPVPGLGPQGPGDGPSLAGLHLLEHHDVGGCRLEVVDHGADIDALASLEVPTDHVHVVARASLGNRS